MKTFLFIYSLLFALPTFALDALRDERIIERYLIFTLCLFVLICLAYYLLKKMGFGVGHVTILDKTEDALNGSQLEIIAFKVIRIRSMILEALLNTNVIYHSSNNKELNDSIMQVCFKTSDVIEHIAQEAMNNKLSAESLVGDLESALYILERFEVLLKYSTSNLPNRDEIHHLINCIQELKEEKI
ncbi:TPA: hypothetical protein I7D23_003527 [Vibrio cholerae]|nr:hypothetical protein [Vibrio cholerae]